MGLVLTISSQARPLSGTRYRSWGFTIVVLLAAVTLVVRLERRALFSAAGDFLVAEDQLAPVEMIVVSNADAAADAFEAARLYHEGIGSEILLTSEMSDPLDDELRKIGVSRHRSEQLASWILDASGVPKSAVTLLNDPTDGTETEIAALADFARQRLPGSVLYVTQRTHTARARWLLRRHLPTQIHVLVRSPRTDDFAPDSWWQTRGGTREVIMEYLRWMNTGVLGDLWSARTN